MSEDQFHVVNRSHNVEGKAGCEDQFHVVNCSHNVEGKAGCERISFMW